MGDNDVSSLPRDETAYPRASLLGLPNEILLQILDCLPCLDVEDFQLLTIKSLSSTNRRLHQFVSHRLYEGFDSFFCTPYIFLTRVLSDAEAASHVRSVTFCYGPHVHEDRPKYVPNSTEKQAIEDGLQRLNLTNWRELALACNEGSAEQACLYAAILMCTPNITNLKIDAGIVGPEAGLRQPSWSEAFNQGVHLGRTHQFTSLTSFHIDVGDLKLDHLALVLTLPSLRKAKLIGLVEWARESVVDGRDNKVEALERLYPANSLYLEELCLDRSYLKAEFLGVLILSVQNLRVLEYNPSAERFHIHGITIQESWSRELALAMSHREMGKLPYSNIQHALLKHRNSLETLRLRPRPNAQGYYLQYLGMIDHLGGLDRLEHLEASLHALTVRLDLDASTVLPRSLRSLTMVNCMCEYPSQADYARLLLWSRMNFPALQTVRVDLTEGNIQPECNWSALALQAEELDINLEVHHLDDGVDDCDNDDEVSDESDESESQSDSSSDGEDDG